MISQAAEAEHEGKEGETGSCDAMNQLKVVRIGNKDNNIPIGWRMSRYVIL